MNNLLLFIIFGILCFGIVSLAIAFFKKDAIFTLSIGCVIGANVYNIGAYPIQIGNFVFGLDGVVYSVFLFCILIMYVDYGKKDLNLVLYTALFSIFLTAFLSCFGSIIQNGELNSTLIWSTLSYIFSIVATYVAVLCMYLLFKKLKSKNFNSILSFFISLLVGNLTNSIIYFGLTFLTSGSLGNNFMYSLVGSLITKVVSVAICTLIFFLYEKYWNKKAPMENKEDLQNK